MFSYPSSVGRLAPRLRRVPVAAVCLCFWMLSCGNWWRGSWLCAQSQGAFPSVHMPFWFLPGPELIMINQSGRSNIEMSFCSACEAGREGKGISWNLFYPLDTCIFCFVTPSLKGSLSSRGSLWRRVKLSTFGWETLTGINGARL